MATQRLSLNAQSWFYLAEKLEWKSYDPYDLLLSPYLKRFQLSSPLIARLLVQFGKPSGINLRRILKIVPHEETKVFSDFLSAAVNLMRIGQIWAEIYIPFLIRKIEKIATSTPGGKGWGLSFPYTSRFVNVPAFTPNIYQTTGVVHSLLDVYEWNGDLEAFNLAKQGCSFILQDLGCFELKGQLWFRYWPKNDAPVINIQASLSGLFARLGVLSQEQEFSRIAERLVSTVMGQQRSDGSWTYSADGKANFIDGFHTGFTLQGLSEYQKYLSSNEVEKSWKAGFNFFKKELITDDGMPRGFAGGSVSLDGQNFAQCVQTLALCAQDFFDIRMSFHLWKNMVQIPQLSIIQENKSQRHRKIKYPQLRWTISPAVLATSYLLLASSQHVAESLS